MSLRNRILWLVVFSVAMGYLETAVVVYLRQLYYPLGFGFPLVPLSPEVGLVEILREAATLMMLAGVAMLSGPNARQRLAFFLLAFAIWDLSYYVFLKLLLNWPASWLTWDILFLIPVPWIGPVLSPVIASFSMIAMASVILRCEILGISMNLGWRSWSLLLSGCLLIVGTWMSDYIAFSGRIIDSPERTLAVLAAYVPHHFNWWLFSVGEGFIIAGIIMLRVPAGRLAATMYNA